MRKRPEPSIKNSMVKSITFLVLLPLSAALLVLCVLMQRSVSLGIMEAYQLMFDQNVREINSAVLQSTYASSTMITYTENNQLLKDYYDAATPYQKDIAFVQRHVLAQSVGIEDALVVVVHGHGKNFLGLMLPDDVFVQPLLDLLRGKQTFTVIRAFQPVAGNNVIAGLDAIVADARAVLYDEVARLQLAASAEGAAQRFAACGLGGIAHTLFALFLRHLSA